MTGLFADATPYGVQDGEAAIFQRVNAGDLRGALALALAKYGPELYGFVRQLSYDEELARDAYGALCEDLWKGFPSFRWESSFRTWAYTVARHACTRQTRKRRPAERASVSDLEAVADTPPRTETRPYLRTDVKSRFSALRDRLTTEERLLLSLRVDRELSWNDIARILNDGASSEDLATQAATCRKRFERAKIRLRALAEAEGLLRAEA